MSKGTKSSWSGSVVRGQTREDRVGLNFVIVSKVGRIPMPSNRLKARMVASLSLVILAFSATAKPTEAGPISEMLARRRQGQQLKLPPMDKPFSTKPVRDLNAKTTSLSQRFKQRFHLKRGGSDGAGTDTGVVKTSR